MICPLCHKPYVPRINTTLPGTNMTFCAPMGDVCHGLNIIFTTYTANTTASVPLQSLNLRTPPLYISGSFDQCDGLRDLLFPKEPAQPEEEKPLEWAEVEQQLDAFMATLNGRNG